MSFEETYLSLENIEFEGNGKISDLDKYKKSDNSFLNSLKISKDSPINVRFKSRQKDEIIEKDSLKNFPYLPKYMKDKKI